MATADAKSLLKRCPRCGYSLRGLPVEHRCPECGFDVDRRWRVFGGRTLSTDTRQALRPIRLIVIAAAVFLIAQAILIMGLTRSFVPPTPCLFWTLILAVLAYVDLSRPKSFIAVGPNGILIYRGDHQVQQYDWPVVEPPHRGRKLKFIVLHVEKQRLVLPAREFFHWYYWETERCIQCINDYARRAKEQGARSDDKPRGLL